MFFGFIVPLLAMMTFLAMVVFAIYQKEQLLKRKNDPNVRTSSLARDGDSGFAPADARNALMRNLPVDEETPVIGKYLSRHAKDDGGASTSEGTRTGGQRSDAPQTGPKSTGPKSSDTSKS